MILSGFSFDQGKKSLTAVKLSGIDPNERAIVQLERGVEYDTLDHLYFEVEILKSDEQEPPFAIGFARRGHNSGMTGWYELSIGFHADDGLVFDSNTHGKFAPSLRKSKVGDIVGALWCKGTGIIVFSHDGFFFVEHLFYRSHRGECSDFLPTITCNFNQGLELRLRTGNDCTMPQKEIQTVLRTVIPRNRILTHEVNRDQSSMIMSSKLPENNETSARSVVQVIGDTSTEIGGIHYFEILIKNPNSKKKEKEEELTLLKEEKMCPSIGLGFARRGHRIGMVGDRLKEYSVGCHGDDGHVYDGGIHNNIGFKASENDVLGVIWDKQDTGLMLFNLNGKQTTDDNKQLMYFPPHRSFIFFHDFLPTVTLNGGDVQFELLIGEKCRLQLSGQNNWLERLRLERFRCGPGVRLSNKDIFDADFSPYMYDDNEEEDEEKSKKHINERASVQILGDSTRVKGLQYFEVEIIDCGRDLNPVIGIGFANLGYNKHGYGMVGWNDNSIGFHADDGAIFDSNGNSTVKTGFKLTSGDVFGACWDELSGVIRFSCWKRGMSMDRDDNNIKILKEFAFPRRRVDHLGFVPTVTLKWGRWIQFKVHIGEESTKMKKKDLLEFMRKNN